jgi:D12 class N6 adenine-specific DNA methyltransferase
VTAATEPLKTPFPYAGGKAKVADLVWSRLGNVDNFLEPFAGSLAVLMRRPADHFADGYRVETVNDLNHYIANFWRAVKADPDAVAEYADSPVLEADLHARHKWLVRSKEAVEFREKMRTDPEHYDAKIAGWWCWGQCCWIGGAWCSDDTRSITPETVGRQSLHAGGEGGVLGNLNGTSHQVKRQALGNSRGVLGENPTDWEQVPDIDGARGVLGRPQLADAFDIGRGVNAGGYLSRPNIGGGGGTGGIRHAAMGVIDIAAAGTCSARREWLTDWFRRLSDRLRLVRTCYGHWSRICDSDSTLTRLGLTGAFLDPPYPSHSTNGKKSRDANLYATDKGADLNALRDEVLAWCRKWGQDKQIRVAVCGYEGDGYEALESEGWSVESWEANGGYANQRRAGKGKSENAKRERIWFSPACVKPDTSYDLFAGHG